MSNRIYKEKFFELMEDLKMIFPAGEVSSKAGGVYFKYLNDIPIEFLEKGLTYLIKKRLMPTFPTIAEIRKECWGENEQFDCENREKRGIKFIKWAKEDAKFNKKVEKELK